MSDYAGPILGVVGAVVGFYVGGPAGAQWGYAIGSMIGGAYASSQQVLPGPKIGDVQKQTSQEGGFRPIVFGRSVPMSGNIIADSEPVIVKREEDQGKGGPKVATEYAYRTYAVGFGEGECELLQAWRNGILVADFEDPSMSAENAKFLEYARWYTGSFEQMADPDLEGVYGVGNAPFFRGTMYLVLASEDVTDGRGMWSQWQVRVFRGAVSPEVPAEWMLISGAGLKDSPDGLDWSSSFVDPVPLPGNDWKVGGYTELTYGEGEVFGLTSVPDGTSPYGAFRDSGEVWRDVTGITVSSGRQRTAYSGTHWFASGPAGFVSADGQTFSGLGYDLIGLCKSSTGVFGWVSTGNSTIFTPRWVDADGAGYTDGTDFQFLTPSMSPYAPVHGLFSSGLGGSTVLAGAVEAFGSDPSDYRVHLYISTGAGAGFAEVTSPFADFIDAAPRRPLVQYSEGLELWMVVVDDKVAIGATPASLVLSGHTLAQKAHGIGEDGAKFVVCGDSGMLEAYDPVNGWQTLSSGTSAPIYDVVAIGDVTPPGTGNDWTLVQVIESVCGRANLTSDLINLELMDQEKIVRGYTIGNSYMAGGILQTLSGVFFFDPANKNGKVAFVPRGRDAEDTILQDDMIDNGEDIEERKESSESRKDGISIPRVLHLNYYDVLGGLNTDKQRSERPEGTRAEFEQSLQTPVVLSADEAATVVSITHGLMAEQQKGELNFALPDNWLRLIESDAVFVETDTKMVRAILTRVQTDEGEQRYKAIRDRQSLYTKSVQGIPAAPVTRPPSSVAGATIIEFIDVPVLRDSHDMLGFRMGVSGVLPAWPGALVEMSTDSGATYLEAQSTRVSSVMGELITALGDHPAEFPDEVNTCQIQINTPNVTLENTDLAGMLNRRNQAIIGDEIVNFATPDEISEGVWEISYWLRGRKHTDAVAHSIGERFVLLGTTLFIPAELAWLNRTLTFRATTFGRPVSEATIISATFTGQSQTEFAPAYLQARRDGGAGGDAVISWQGVGRLGGGANVAMGAYFQGYRVTLTDGSVTQTFDQVTESITTSLSAFTGPVTVRVQQRNQLTGLGPYIEVII